MVRDACLLCVLMAILQGCPEGCSGPVLESRDSGTDADTAPVFDGGDFDGSVDDAGVDAPGSDSGPEDGGPEDGGPEDGGPEDAMADASVEDAMADAPLDSGGPFTLGGTVVGLQGELTLQSASGETLTITEDGPFVFGEELEPGATYEVTVTSEPGIQLCQLREGSGTATADVNVQVVCDELFFFRIRAPSFGYEVWQSDGTERGTRIVADIQLGSGNGVERRPARVLDLIYLDTYAGTWVTDGTMAGTREFAPMMQNVPVPLGDRFFFVGLDDAGLEPWISDQDGQNAARLADVQVGATSGFQGEAATLGDRVFFTGRTGTAVGSELWSSDGTPEGTALFVDIDPAGSSFPRFYIPLGNMLLFHAETADAGRELWRTDGTVAGTTMVADIQPGTESGVRNGNLGMVVFNGLAFFPAEDGEHGREPWVTDGTAEGTLMLADTVPGPDGGGTLIYEVTPAGVYFEANTEAGYVVYFSDGTVSGTRELDFIPPEPETLGTAGGLLFYNWDDGVHGPELWRTDGTPEGTMMVADIVAGEVGSDPSVPEALDLSMHDLFLFLADDGVHGQEPWVTDGTEEGTHLLSDLEPGSGSVS